MLDRYFVALVNAGVDVRHFDTMLGVVINGEMYEIRTGPLPGHKGSFVFREDVPKLIKTESDIVAVCQAATDGYQESGKESIVIYKRQAWFLQVKRVA